MSDTSNLYGPWKTEVLTVRNTTENEKGEQDWHNFYIPPQADSISSDQAAQEKSSLKQCLKLTCFSLLLGALWCIALATPISPFTAIVLLDGGVVQFFWCLLSMSIAHTLAVYILKKMIFSHGKQMSGLARVLLAPLTATLFWVCLLLIAFLHIEGVYITPPNSIVNALSISLLAGFFGTVLSIHINLPLGIFSVYFLRSYAKSIGLIKQETGK